MAPSGAVFVCAVRLKLAVKRLLDNSAVNNSIRGR